MTYNYYAKEKVSKNVRSSRVENIFLKQSPRLIKCIQTKTKFT